jgi:hypothetical protein
MESSAVWGLGPKPTVNLHSESPRSGSDFFNKNRLQPLPVRRKLLSKN